MEPEIVKEIQEFAEKMKTKKVGVCFIVFNIVPETKKENTTMVTTIALPLLSLILRKKIREIEKKLDSTDVEVDPLTGGIKSPLQML